MVHLTAITRVYGDRGADVLDLLAKNPAAAVPAVLARLKDKHAEWVRARHEHAKSWKKTMDTNYRRSLDHRSLYSRIDDLRQCSVRWLVQEIREKREERLEVVLGWREPV